MCGLRFRVLQALALWGGAVVLTVWRIFHIFLYWVEGARIEEYVSKGFKGPKSCHPKP